MMLLSAFCFLLSAVSTPVLYAGPLCVARHRRWESLTRHLSCRISLSHQSTSHTALKSAPPRKFHLALISTYTISWELISVFFFIALCGSQEAFQQARLNPARQMTAAL